MDIVKGVVVELRPLLRCCNVFLLTNRLVIQDHLVVTVRPDCVVVSYNKYPETVETKAKSKRNRALRNRRKNRRNDSTSSYESYSDSDEESFDYAKFMNMKPFCRLIPGSLTNLKIENGSVSFRVLTEPVSDDSGNFFSEIVDSSKFEIKTTSAQDRRQTVNLQKNAPVSLHCGNCLNKITSGEVTFARVLELPSENMDVSDWFCHMPGDGHHHGDEANDQIKQFFNLEPSETDLFFGRCHFVASTAVFSDAFKNFNAKREAIHCNRCLSCLGSKRTAANFYKFWNAGVKFIGTSSEFNLFSYGQNNAVFCDDLPLRDVLYLIEQLMKDSLIGPQMATSCRIILECDGPPRRNSLLIWVMDRRLDVLRNDEDPNSNMKNSDGGRIHLRRCAAVKVLYLVTDDATVVGTGEWKDPSVQVANVSKEMMVSLSSHLVNNSNLVPESFRRTSGYFVSYFFM